MHHKKFVGSGQKSLENKNAEEKTTSGTRQLHSDNNEEGTVTSSPYYSNETPETGRNQPTTGTSETDRSQEEPPRESRISTASTESHVASETDKGTTCSTCTETEGSNPSEDSARSSTSSITQFDRFLYRYRKTIASLLDQRTEAPVTDTPVPADSTGIDTDFYDTTTYSPDEQTTAETVGPIEHTTGIPTAAADAESEALFSYFRKIYNEYPDFRSYMSFLWPTTDAADGVQEPTTYSADSTRTVEEEPTQQDKTSETNPAESTPDEHSSTKPVDDGTTDTPKYLPRATISKYLKAAIDNPDAIPSKSKTSATDFNSYPGLSLEQSFPDYPTGFFGSSVKFRSHTSPENIFSESSFEQINSTFS